MSVAKRPDGRWRPLPERARHFTRKVDAERWLVEQQSKVNRGEWVDPALGQVRVGE